MVVLENAVKRNNNNYDLIRLFAALLVVFGHSLKLFANNGYVDPFQAWLGFDYSGSIAVYIFFFLSGIFITASFINSESPVRYITMRIFRIWPALITCVLITVFVIGPALSVSTLKAYFDDRQTWSYLVRNISLINIRYVLPGVFENNHYPIAVNGSLWTLPLEIGCYALVLIMGLLRIFAKSVIMIVVYALLFMMYFTNNKVFIYLGGNTQLMFFLVGSLVYYFRKYVYLDAKICITLIAACLIAEFVYHPMFRLLFYVSLLYIVLYIGVANIAKRINLPGDYSYGVYIYGFLIQQIFAHFLPHINFLTSLIVTLPVIVSVSALSWHCIEHPAINFAKKLSKRKRFGLATRLQV